MNAGNKPRGGTAKERSVFVGNIPYDVSEEQLREIFSEVGSVVNFRLVTDRESGKPKGYGFCEYADGATALSAMRNLNGYEVNGRNLRVDFADGGDKSSSNSGGGGADKAAAPTSVSGEVLINAIEGAIAKFGPVKLYDMLVQLKEHARQRPEYTKGMLNANPALTHAVVQCFKTLHIPIPTSAETHPALLPPPLLPAPGGMPMAMGMGRPLAGVLPPPQRSPMNAGGPPGGGILGMAPPGVSMAPPPTLSAPPPAKAGGTRWSSRPGPMAAPTAPVSGGMAGMSHHGAPPPPMVSHAPVVTAPQQQQQQPPLMPTPPAPVASATRSRDPRRARDPRLAKRPSSAEPPMAGADAKRIKTEDGREQMPGHPGPVNGGGSEYDAIAELARDMTPEKMNMLPPAERQIIMGYMQQHGIQLQYQHPR